jgi:type IV pilus assembly protein PilN
MRVAGPRDKAVALVRNLEHSRRFLSPRIVGETAQSQNQNGRQNPNFEPVSAMDGVNFEVLAEYNPLPPREAKHGAAEAAATAKKKVAPGKERRVAHIRKPAPGRSTP